MALERRNSFQGGTNGTAITPANSGGASGDAFSAVTTAGSAAFTYSTAHPQLGTLGAKLVQPAGSSGFFEWTYAAETTLFGRAYMWIDGTFNQQIEWCWLQDGDTRVAGARFTGAGVLRVIDAAGSGTSGTVAVVTGQLVCAEFKYVAGATGTIEAKLFNSAQSTTPAERPNLVNDDGGPRKGSSDLIPPHP